MTGRARSDGILYGPTGRGKLYLSMFAHRGARPVKTAWHMDITPDIEFWLFDKGDENDWQDERGHFWSLGDGDGDGATILGMTGERLCKHPRNTSTAAPWHGYPVSPRDTATPTPRRTSSSLDGSRKA
jgi:hypothetical protein